MASCLQLPLSSSYSLTSSTTSLTSSKNRVSSIKSRSVIKSIRNGVPKLPMSLTNPNDPFLKKLASVASESPETLLQRPKGSNMLPFLDILNPSARMAAPDQVETPASYDRQRNSSAAPDLPSKLLHERIVYIGLPLFNAVTELVVAQLFHLQYEDPEEPISIYINSSGTTRDDDDEPVGLETNGFAIYDIMREMKNEIHTLGLGAAVGEACLLLSAGTKGKRFMIPNATAVIQQPRVPPSGLMPTSDVAYCAREALINRDTLVRLLARHTRHSAEEIAHIMSEGRFHMNATQAKEFGIIDQIWPGPQRPLRPQGPRDEDDMREDMYF